MKKVKITHSLIYAIICFIGFLAHSKADHACQSDKDCGVGSQKCDQGKCVHQQLEDTTRKGNKNFNLHPHKGRKEKKYILNKEFLRYT